MPESEIVVRWHKFKQGSSPDVLPRCFTCNTPLAIVSGRPWVIDCRKCKTRNAAGDIPVDIGWTLDINFKRGTLNK